MPSASSSLSRSERSRSERSGTSCLISEKRSGPSRRTIRIAPVHRLPTSSTARWYSEQQAGRLSQLLPGCRVRSGDHDLNCKGTGGRAGLRDRTAGSAYAALQKAGLLDRPVPGHVAGAGDEVREGVQRHVRHGLEDLLVLPARLACLLVEVERRRPVALEQRLDVAQQRRLALVVGVELPCQAISSMPRPASRPVRCQRGQGVLAALVLEPPPARCAAGSSAAACRGEARTACARRRAAWPERRPARRRCWRAGRHRPARP